MTPVSIVAGICAAAFLAAAAAIAVVNAGTPIARGWWLVAYLALVGGVAQLLLVPGLAALGRRRGAPVQDARGTLAQLVLWNAGTVIVAVANLASAPGAVLVGSGLLTAALALSAGGLRQIGATASRPAPGWTRAYGLLLGFLAVSVVVGTILAHAPR